MFKKLRSTLSIVLLSTLLSLPFAVTAQEATEAAPTEAPIEVVVVEAPAEEDVSSDSSPALPESFSTIAFAAPLVTLLVALLKRYVKNTSAGTLNFTLSLIVFVLYTIASQNGLASQFEAFTGDISSIVNALSNLLTGVVGTAVLSAGIYHASDKANVPFLGASRPPVVAPKKAASE